MLACLSVCRPVCLLACMPARLFPAHTCAWCGACGCGCGCGAGTVCMCVGICVDMCSCTCVCMHAICSSNNQMDRKLHTIILCIHTHHSEHTRTHSRVYACTCKCLYPAVCLPQGQVSVCVVARQEVGGGAVLAGKPSLLLPPLVCGHPLQGLAPVV